MAKTFKVGEKVTCTDMDGRAVGIKKDAVYTVAGSASCHDFVKFEEVEGNHWAEAFEVVSVEPPLGLRPREIAEAAFRQERVKEIVEAMSRYTEAGKDIPAEWISELAYRN